MEISEVTSLLRTKNLGRRIRFYPSIDSTNEELKRILLRGEEGCVVAADTQTAGRGRQSNLWWSPPGVNIYVSLPLNVGTAIPEDIPQAALAVGVAVHKGLSLWVPPGRLTLKWPNDILLDSKKLAGILCELIVAADGKPTVIAGIGVNVSVPTFPPHLAGIATSLLIAGCGKPRREAVLAALLNEIEPVAEAFRQGGLSQFLDDYQKRCTLHGRRVRVGDFEGTYEGISSKGGLLLRLDDGSIREILTGSLDVL